MMSEPVIAPEIEDQSRRELKPIVALESTVITHGLPYPENVELALKMEEIIAAEGAIPATIALHRGEVKAGLTEDEIEELARDERARKISRRDIAPAVAQGLSGGTTVAATMAIACRAGINFFVTGGIGGVHRGGGDSFDISADLQEFARTPVTVISAGVKAILDIGLTLQRLETLGVPVLGYRTDRFPAFYYRDSGYNVPCRVDHPQDIARITAEQQELKLEAGILVGNPIPEESALSRDEVERAIEEALQRAEREKSTGQDLTPFLLGELEEITSGSTLEANLRLLENNARLGARTALAYRRLIS